MTIGPTIAPSIAAARAALVRGELDPQTLVRECLHRLADSESVVRAWVHIDAERSLDEARRLDPGERDAPLWGIPLGVKDVIDVVGMPTTASSKVLAGNVATADAAVVGSLRRAGAVILGKTNTHEFAYGCVTPPTVNPWDARRIPGGSSGGSAAAIAEGHCLGALGTDTAGSIRIPSALCGVCGLAPRPGRVWLDGVIPLAPSLDVVGPMAGSVEDLVILWQAMTGKEVHGREPQVVAAPRDALPALDRDVAAGYEAALDVLVSAGLRVRGADVPAFQAFDVPRGRVLMHEALEVHRSRGWWPARADAYSEETASYLDRAGTTLTAEIADAARRRCAELAAGLHAVLDDADLIATPTVPCTAPTHEEAARPGVGARRPVVIRLTRIPGPVNLARLAALSIPCGLGDDALPIGLQLIGRSEEVVLAAGRAFERETDWHLRRPARNRQDRKEVSSHAT
ncbi:MAG: amidase [Actinomycetota bacterium]